MEKKILIKNAKAIVTCDSQDSVFYNADMLIQGPKIISIGENLSDDDAEILDASGKFVYPGMINTHHHFFQTFFRNLLTIDYPNMLVVEWLDKIYKIFQLTDGDVIYYSTIAALSDLVKHGCTCAFDHQYCYTKATGKEPVDRQMEAAAQLGIRYHAGRGCNTLPRSEGSTIPADMLETTDEFLNDCDRLIGKYHDSNPFSMSQIVVSPCQPINSYPETFVESVKFARDKGVHMHTHLGEGENCIMQERWGKRTLDWCQEIGFVGKDVWIAHGWELLPEEYKTMADTQTGVSHCPGPAVLGGFPILDMKKMQEAGVLISLGCDGSATNDSSNLLDSLRVGYMMQAFHTKQRGGCVTPYDMLKIATINGAKTLGRMDLGSLEEGKAADLFMIDTDVPELIGTLHDPKNLLARVGVTGPVWMTMINGKIVFKDGQLLGIDEAAITAKGEETCTRIIRNNCEYF